MSYPVTMYFCTACDFQQGDVCTWGYREYVLEDGVCIPASWKVGWCDVCGGLAAVEDLSPNQRYQEIDAAQQALAEQTCSRSLSELTDAELSARQSYMGRIDNARNSLKMLSARTSPPRCMSCLSTQVKLPEHLTDLGDNRVAQSPAKRVFLHPNCGGEIQSRIVDDFRIALRHRTRWFTPEGLLIETVSTPDM